jgi:hypothetical protein
MAVRARLKLATLNLGKRFGGPDARGSRLGRGVADTARRGPSNASAGRTECNGPCPGGQLYLPIYNADNSRKRQDLAGASLTHFFLRCVVRITEFACSFILAQQIQPTALLLPCRVGPLRQAGTRPLVRIVSYAMLRSSGFLRVHLAASGIRKPSLERRAELFRRLLAQRGLVDRRARMRESRRHRRREGNSDDNERHCRDYAEDPFEHDQSPGVDHLEEGDLNLVPPVRMTLAQYGKQPRKPGSAGLYDLGHGLASRAKHALHSDRRVARK